MRPFKSKLANSLFANANDNVPCICAVFRYDNVAYNAMQKLPKTKPEPWLHVAICYNQFDSWTGTGEFTYAIFVWDTRKILEVGDTSSQGSSKALKTYQSPIALLKQHQGQLAKDNRQPLVGDKAAMFNQVFGFNKK